MNDKVNYVTAEGLENLKAELKNLKTVKQRELAERLDAARQLGDLSENAEYHEAKHQLGLVQSRILQIGEILKNVSVIGEDQARSGVVGEQAGIADWSHNDGKMIRLSFCGRFFVAMSLLAQPKRMPIFIV